MNVSHGFFHGTSPFLQFMPMRTTFPGRRGIAGAHSSNTSCESVRNDFPPPCGSGRLPGRSPPFKPPRAELQ